MMNNRKAGMRSAPATPTAPARAMPAAPARPAVPAAPAMPARGGMRSQPRIQGRFAKGGAVDGCAQRGKTKGTMR